jgi:hypothetical protein
LPLPVAILHACRGSLVPAADNASVSLFRMLASESFGAASVRKIRVSSASIWQKNRRRSRSGRVQYSSRVRVIGVMRGYPCSRHSVTRERMKLMSSFSLARSAVHSVSNVSCLVFFFGAAIGMK